MNKQNQILASGVIKFSDGTEDFAEVVLHQKTEIKFITIGVGSGGFNGMSVQLTPNEFISGAYDDVIFGLKLTWLLRSISRIGPNIVTAADISLLYKEFCENDEKS
jgi:hypothetical protein